jgi:acetylornithine/N-succinyldiaminopimelate aminotransferase
MLEPVQGESGVHVGSAEYLRGLRALCDEAGVLLVLDEVQTGVGRSGKLFSHEWADITPDIMAVAKGIGGGFPLGAVLATEEAAAGLTPGTHGSTFGGNPLATRVGYEVLDVVLEPGFLEAVQQRALRLRQSLARIQDQFPDLVTEVRGQGLLAGIKVNAAPADVVAAALGEQLLVVGAGDNVVRVLPPLTVGDDEIAEGVERLARALARVSEAARSIT